MGSGQLYDTCCVNVPDNTGFKQTCCSPNILYKQDSATWWHTAVLLYRRLPAAGPQWRTRSFSARQSLSGWRREGAGWLLWGQSLDHSPLSQYQEGTECLWRGWGSWGRGRSQACVSLTGAPLSSRETDEGCTEKNRYIENGQAESNEDRGQKHNNWVGREEREEDEVKTSAEKLSEQSRDVLDYRLGHLTQVELHTLTLLKEIRYQP